jgi:amidase
MSDLTVDSTAREQADAVRRRQVSARELLDLHLVRIGERNPELNAIVSLDEERARAGAAAADEALAAGAEVGALHGLPFAFKDTHGVAGWRTTYGSPLFADHVSERDDLIVERVRRAGVVVIGKTNVPEFAAGSHTFNRVFGLTRNPVDPSRSAGGSSGGAACALAAGMVPLADGSDMGGSLRNPASFCGVVGLRPSLGRVPEWPLYNQWETTSVGGPLARNVGDLALLLSVMAGPDPRAPQALTEPGSLFLPPVVGSLSGLRVALSIDLGGAFEVDAEVASIVSSSASVFTDAGASVAAAHPLLAEADDTFRTLRAWHFQAKFGLMLAASPDEFKPALADNIRAGESLTGADVARAYSQRTALSERMRLFFESHDVLVLPVSQVPPFPADQEYPTSINGRPMETYLDWMRAAYFITVTGCPAISVPFGTTADGLPVGIQIVAPRGRDRFLLEVAEAFEAAVSEPARTPGSGGDAGAAATWAAESDEQEH